MNKEKSISYKCTKEKIGQCESENFLDYSNTKFDSVDLSKFQSLPTPHFVYKKNLSITKLKNFCPFTRKFENSVYITQFFIARFQGTSSQ